VDLLPDHDALLADIEDLLARGDRNPAAYGEQTSTRLQELTAPHWRRFFAEMRRIVSCVAETSAGALDEGVVHLRAWASRLRLDGDPSERRLWLGALHNHSPAFLSAVYFLRLPAGTSKGEGGTCFVNPFPHSLVSPHPGVVIAPAEGRVIVFPSWLMHGPLPTARSTPGLPRVVIAVDAHFIPR
jgi:hypothetical protein